jgi:hypothetical protein
VNYPRNLPNGSNLAAELVDAFPTLLAPRATTPTLTSALTFVNIPTDTQLPTTHFWSLSVQRQLHQNYVLELGYTGNRSYHLYRQSQTNPGILSSAKADAVRANCTFATLSSCQDPTGFPTSPSRVDPRWGIRILLEATGQAEYHAGYIRLDKKLSHGLQFGLNYTWSANLSDSEELFTAEPLITASSPATPQNFFDRRGEWSRSVFDRPHRLAFHYSYRVPGFTNAQAILRHALSGWQLAGFTEAQSGQPFTIRVGVDTLGNGQTGASQAGRPDYNPGGILILDPVTHDLRTFTIPLDGTGIVTAPSVVDPVTGARTFLKNSMPLGGTLGRNTFRGPGFFNTNWSLSKTFSLPRDTRLQIRGDFINVFNHDNFPNPDSNMTNAATRTFGTQTLAPLTDARQVLLGAKISF